MPINTAKPVTISEPDVPYDRLLLDLSIATFVTSDRMGVDSSVNLTQKCFRVLSDGTHELAPKEAGERYHGVGSAAAEAQADPDFAKCYATIYAALQEFIAAKGI